MSLLRVDARAAFAMLLIAAVPAVPLACGESPTVQGVDGASGSLVDGADGPFFSFDGFSVDGGTDGSAQGEGSVTGDTSTFAEGGSGGSIDGPGEGPLFDVGDLG